MSQQELFVYLMDSSKQINYLIKSYNENTHNGIRKIEIYAKPSFNKSISDIFNKNNSNEIKTNAETLEIIKDLLERLLSAIQ